MKTLTPNAVIAILGIALLAMISAFLMFGQANPVLSSVETGQEYNATTTFAASAPAQRLLQTGYGALGSVVITGDNTGTITFYNATTSNVSARTGNVATSSILIADFPASSPEGTYTFDVTYTTGLLMITSGAPATSTVTWR